MKKILVSMFLLVFALCMAGCETIVDYASLLSIVKEENFNDASVASFRSDVRFKVEFNDLKEQVFYINIMNSMAKPTDVLPEEVPIWSLYIKSGENALRIDNMSDLYAKYNDEWYLIKCSKEDKIALNNYLLVTNGDMLLNTKANFTFFPTEKNDLHNVELLEAYEVIASNHESYGEYEIYNFINEEIGSKYNLDIFQVQYSSKSLYFLKHNEALYHISPFPLNNQNNHCLTHVAITDINDDGYIEILTSIISYSNKERGYATSFIKVTDTFTGYSIEIVDYDNINYFKENEEGVISIYNANGVYPISTDLTNGKLDEKYYDLANNLFDTPVLNTSKYEFKEKYLEATCELYSVKITIEDNSINFPYLFKSTLTPPSFEINVEMTYLGETFIYVNSNTYLDGAVVVFINDDNEIICDPWAAGDAITTFVIYNGMIIERTYSYSEDLNNLNKVGLYDMVIIYQNEYNDLYESITIKDFLSVTR